MLLSLLDYPRVQRNMTLHGVPDMVAEIFSRSTMQRDTTIKKDIYERNGVREYWMIDPWRETVEIYLLSDGKYIFAGRYENYSEDELASLTDEERASIELEVPVAILDGFKIKVKNIFGWYLDKKIPDEFFAGIFCHATQPLLK